MEGWSVKVWKRCTQVTTGEASFSQQTSNQVRSREKIPVFGEQDDWTRMYNFIQPLVLRCCFQMEPPAHREWKQYWIVKGKLCFKKKAALDFSNIGRVLGGGGRKEGRKMHWLKWKGTIMGLLLLSLVHMLATTCIYLQVTVIHQLPEGFQIMMVLILWRGAGKSLCNVASGSPQPLRYRKTCTPFLRSPTEKVQEKNMRRI